MKSQKATGSTSSTERMSGMVNKLNTSPGVVVEPPPDLRTKKEKRKDKRDTKKTNRYIKQIDRKSKKTEGYGDVMTGDEKGNIVEIDKGKRKSKTTTTKVSKGFFGISKTPISVSFKNKKGKGTTYNMNTSKNQITKTKSK